MGNLGYHHHATIVRGLEIAKKLQESRYPLSKPLWLHQWKGLPDETATLAQGFPVNRFTLMRKNAALALIDNWPACLGYVASLAANYQSRDRVPKAISYQM